jgi:ATP-dependent RNA helicase SUPV3L1/SUV3
VPGAQITAATIEMFNPRRSGECIIIDEAHMLADDQRGWAWTRAIMEAAAPEIHIVGSPVSEMLINRLAEELGFAVSTERYERLTPLHVAERPWTLEDLPARTILVAFSRRTVLGLKADLEKKFNRSVAVVYGNLPPEVRLRQAERFASAKPRSAWQPMPSAWA